VIQKYVFNERIHLALFLTFFLKRLYTWYILTVLKFVILIFFSL